MVAAPGAGPVARGGVLAFRGAPHVLQKAAPSRSGVPHDVQKVADPVIGSPVIPAIPARFPTAPVLRFYASDSGPASDRRYNSRDLHADGEGEVVEDELEWTYDIPLLTSRFMVWDFVRVILLSVTAMYVIVAVGGLIVEQELIILPAFVFFLTAGIMFGLFVLTSLLLGNRQGARFIVSSRGVEYRAEKRERAINRLAVLVGLLALNPTTAGAGTLAMTREKMFLPWESIERVVVYPRPRVIALRNSWRTVLRLHCTPELFDQVVSRVEAHHRVSRPNAGTGEAS